MPCDSSHMDPTSLEREMSKVYCLLDELSGSEIVPRYWEGYHPKAYGGPSRSDADRAVSMLCEKLSKVADIRQYSLEMQMWWRGHQKADKERLEREIAEKKTEEAKLKALAKLTDYEREILGL